MRNNHIVLLVFDAVSIPCSSTWSGRDLTPVKFLGKSVTPMQNIQVFFPIVPSGS